MYQIKGTEPIIKDHDELIKEFIFKLDMFVPELYNYCFSNNIIEIEHSQGRSIIKSSNDVYKDLIYIPNGSVYSVDLVKLNKLVEYSDNFFNTDYTFEELLQSLLTYILDNKNMIHYWML